MTELPVTELPVTDGAVPPFSYPVRLAVLGRGEAAFEIEADAPARAGLVRLLGLVDMTVFRASLRLKWVQGRRLLRLTGRLYAEIVQTCVVTLEPVGNTVEESFEIQFEPQSPAAGQDSAASAAPEGEAGAMETVEPLYGDSLDIGDLAAGELALAIDPYPRKTDISLDVMPAPRGGQAAPDERAEVGSERASPFEILAALKGKT